MAVIVRAIGGAGNGNVGVIRTAVAELVPWKELQPRAFSIMPLVWNVGSVLGPALGGALANPLHVPPKHGGKRGMRTDGRFLERFPFALPNLLAAALFIISLFNCFFFLSESLESRRNHYDPGVAAGDKIIKFLRRINRKARNLPRRRKGEEEEPLLKSPSPAETTTGDEESNVEVQHTLNSPIIQKPTSYNDVLSKQSVLNLFVYTVLATHSLGFDQLIPVYLHQERQNPSDPDVQPPFRFKGGFQISSQSIGLLLAFYGAFALLVQFFIFPPAARRYGVLRVYIACSFTFPIVYLLVPFTALLPSSITFSDEQSSTPGGALGPAGENHSVFRLPFNVVILFIVMLFKCTAAVFAFPSSTILLTNSASSLSVLGTLNGIATSISAIGRAAGPAIGGSLSDWGVERSLAWVPWWTFSAISIVGAIASLWLVEGEGFGGDESEVEETVEHASLDEERPLDGLRTPDNDTNRGDAHTTNFDSPVPGNAGTRQRHDTRRLRRVRTTSSTALQQSAIEEEPEDEGGELPLRPASRIQSRRSSIASTVPIGMGRGISRKLSSNLGQSLGSQHSFGE
ncbi:MAG: hypothetical protein M1822_006850 [Bathelium mastoideum]|nr:MAG: hypothetical protein M1822_006850 [Bathelium mastoideum]